MIGVIIEIARNAVPVARGFCQLVVLLTELSPTMVTLWRQWQRSNGRLSADERKRLTSTVKDAVKTKDTADLEAFLTGGAKPADPVAAPETVKAAADGAKQ